jgi:hypothetical protein
MVGGALGASAEREGRPLAVEVLFVREPGLVLTLHIIPFHISLTESLRIASTLIRSGSASGEYEHEQNAEKALQLCSRLEQVLNVPQRVRLRPVLRLRPCWEAFLSILRECSSVVPHVETIEILARQHSFSAGC